MGRKLRYLLTSLPPSGPKTKHGYYYTQSKERERLQYGFLSALEKANQDSCFLLKRPLKSHRPPWQSGLERAWLENELSLCVGEVFLRHPIICQLLLHTAQVARVWVTMSVTGSNAHCTCHDSQCPGNQTLQCYIHEIG